MKELIQGMEKRFDEKFGQYCLGETLGHDEVNQKRLKSFIKDFARSLIEEEIKELEGMKIPNIMDEKYFEKEGLMKELKFPKDQMVRDMIKTGFNSALSTRISHLTNLLKVKQDEICGLMILTPTPLHNGGMWCAERKPCRFHDGKHLETMQELNRVNVK